MFDIASTELLIVAVVALVVIGPKDLPNVMRTVGQWVGRARGMARHFRTGMDAMMREAELDEMEKKWQAENDRIMRDHPMPPADSDWGKDTPAAGAGAATSPPPPEAPPPLPEPGEDKPAPPARDLP